MVNDPNEWAQRTSPKLTPTLGHILEQAGLVNEEMIDEIIRDKMENEAGTTLKKSLIQMGLVREEDIIDAVAAEMGLEKIVLGQVHVTPELLELIPAKIAKQYQIFPVRQDETSIYIALSDPLNIQTTDDLERLLQKHIVPVLASEAEIDRAVRRYYEGDEIASMFKEITSQVEAEENIYQDGYGDLDIDVDAESPENQPAVVRFVDLVFKQAVHERASDIHIEPAKRSLNIRFRVDGVLHDIPSPPLKWQAAIISRLKVLSRMDLAEKRIPQDGRIKLHIQDKNLDLRVNSLPTIYGESIVMRILDQSSVMLGLADVGFLKHNIERFEELIRSPTGIIMMTGPTGSGKTTTLYSALNTLNTPETKIITIENPVEYQLEGIVQVQVNETCDVNFSTGLRAMLRQSPNVIMVGEIRDMETAEIAIRAALTGHLVFSTLHTNDAATSAVRLIDMGIKPYLVASSLEAAIAQRLVRRTCQHCKTAYTPKPEELIDFGVEPTQYADHEFVYGKGCDRCGNSGYRGRTAIHEIFSPDTELKQMIIRSQSGAKLKQAAVKKGMLTLRMDGWEKALAGQTTLTEVLRITQVDE